MIVVTLGDANGLGPEIVCRCFEGRPVSEIVLLVGAETSLEAHASERFWERVDRAETLSEKDGGVFLLVPEALEGLRVAPGKETREGGLAAGESLETACALLGRGLGDALTTCPLSKASLNAAGFAFPGHTEFLADRSGVGREKVCMHLCGPRLRVSLATTHPPLRDVPDLLTRERITDCLRLTWDFVRKLGLGRAPLAVCGLNPHAGEGGLIGREEIDVIIPAVEAAREEGISVEGPLPGDTVFHRAAGGEFDAVLAMYHDQGLAPLKLLHFHESVNVTLGLPFVRTSVGHGTGFDITGRGVVDLGSFRAAFELAATLAG